MFGAISQIAALKQHKASSTWLTIGLIVSSIFVVLAGSAYVGLQQRQLDTIGDQQREMRMARQALMETETAMLNSLVTNDVESGLVAYAAARSKLDTHSATHFPVRALIDGQAVSTADVLASLKRTWTQMAHDIGLGQPQAAEALLIAERAPSKMNGVVHAAVIDIEALDVAYQAKERQIATAIAAVLVLQVLNGILCIFAFTMAARRGVREAAARALAVDSAEQTREQVMRLFQMTDMLQSAADHTDANAVLTSTAYELIPEFGGALYVFNNSRDRLVLSTSWNLEDDAVLPDAIGLQQCWALKRGKKHINHPTSTKLCCEHHTSVQHALEIPMAARGEVLGLLQIYANGEDAETRLNGITEMGAAMADAMSLALSNIALRDKLRGQALRDPLTGLYNRRYMEDTLQRVARLAEREKHELSVIMIDLDHFKRLNDNHGHAKGDAVLRDTAAILINNLRESDVACRYGGEELIVVLPNCSQEMAAQKAERIRQAIEGLSESGGAQVSASLGVASIPSTSASIQDLVKTADAALYVAKEEGRNRVVCAPKFKDRAGKAAKTAAALELIVAE